MTDRARRDAEVVAAVWVTTGLLLLGCTGLVLANDLLAAPAPSEAAPSAPETRAAPPTPRAPIAPTPRAPIAATPRAPIALTSTAPVEGLVRPARPPRRVVVVRRSRAS